MVRTPPLHYDFVLKTPGATELHALVQREFDTLSDADLINGHIPQFLNTLDQVTRISSYLMHLYRRFGQNTFVVGPNVQELFRRTKLARITPDLIQPPAPAFYIALADCPWQIWGGERTKLHNLTGVYVSFSKVYQGKAKTGGTPPELHNCINIVLWGEANERSLSKFDDALLWFSISLDRWVEADQDLETFFANHSVMTATSMDLKDWDPHAHELDPFAQPYLPEDAEALATQRECLVNILRLILNLCLYMGSDEPEVDVHDWQDKASKIRKKLATKKSSGKRKKLERKLSNLPRTRVVYVGPLFEELPDHKDRDPTKEHQGGTHASPIEHGVAPHWQRYWVGSGENRKVKWRLKGMYVRGSGKPDRTLTKIRE